MLENEDNIMDFEEYCAEVLDVPVIDFLSKAEWENYYEKYEKYLQRELKNNDEL
jgi:hypothetical protein